MPPKKRSKPPKDPWDLRDAAISAAVHAYLVGDLEAYKRHRAAAFRAAELTLNGQPSSQAVHEVDSLILEALVESKRLASQLASEPAIPTTVEPSLEPIKPRILEWFTAQGPLGGTSPEAAAALGLSLSSVSTHISQMLRRGSLRETGEVRGVPPAKVRRIA